MRNSLPIRLNKKQLPLLSLFFLVIVLPFNFLLSVGIIGLAISIFFSQPLKTTKENLKNRSDFLLFSSMYLLYLLAIGHTENWSFGMRELEYKLSLFIMPIILAAMSKLSNESFKKVAHLYIISNLLAAFLCLIISLFNASFEYLPTYIELSVFMHPTYASAYLNLAFIFLVKLFRVDYEAKGSKSVFYLMAVLIVGFNFLLNSKIGILVNLLLIFVFLVQAGKRYSKKTLYVSLALFAISVILIFTQVSTIKNRFHYIKRAFVAENIPKETEESTYLRILIWDQAFEVFKENKWIGVGTGDTKDVLMEHYQTNEMTYAYEKKLNAHNQFLEWLITFGLLGLIIYLISIVYPLVRTVKSRQFLYIYFMGSLMLIFLVESFLEREVGLVFFTFFNGLLYYHSPNQQPSLES